MANIKRIREGQKITYVELSERLDERGRLIPVLGLRRIERGERKVDVDDLLALADALNVAPVDLLVPDDLADDAPYGITPTVTTTAVRARAWIGGVGFLRAPESPADLAQAVRFMPKDRAQTAAQSWFKSEIEPGVSRMSAMNRQTNAWEAAHPGELYMGDE